jgi:ATP-dependent protease HslVU (ClpYQ) peptidase subunit
VTTIAYRDGVMAGDGRTTLGDMVVSDTVTKVSRVKGELLGWSGSVEEAEKIKAAVRKGAEPQEGLDVTALRVNSDGDIFLYEGTMWVKKTAPYYAIGTGAPYALGAMDAGADAAQAALIGSKRDTSSGGKIKKVTFRAPK